LGIELRPRAPPLEPHWGWYFKTPLIARLESHWHLGSHGECGMGQGREELGTWVPERARASPSAIAALSPAQMAGSALPEATPQHGNHGGRDAG
jgi:hypothetical protein